MLNVSLCHIPKRKPPYLLPALCRNAAVVPITRFESVAVAVASVLIGVLLGAVSVSVLVFHRVLLSAAYVMFRL